MAGKLFIGFDEAKNSMGLLSSSNGSGNDSASAWTNDLVLPGGVYHNRGVSTLDITSAPANAPTSASSNFFRDGINSAGVGYGAASSAPYTGASVTTRAAWAALQGHQLGVVRSVIGLGGEVWISFDLRMEGGLPNSSIPSSYLPSASWGKLFKFGDVEVAMKETIYTTSHEIVFSVINNGSEVATVSVPGQTTSTWMFCLLHVKLDASTGTVDFKVNGISQSVAYTNQNTVQTTPLASAPYVYIGPPVFDNGTTAYVGTIDTIYFDDAEWPAGRPSIVAVTVSSDGTLTNFAAWGSSPTTVAAALSSPTDTNAAKATASGGSATLQIYGPVLSAYLNDILAVEMVGKRVVNRSTIADRRVQFGYELSGVQTVGLYAKSLPLPFSSITTPPSALNASVTMLEQVFQTQAGTKLQKSSVTNATFRYVIKSVAP